MSDKRPRQPWTEDDIRLQVRLAAEEAGLGHALSPVGVTRWRPLLMQVVREFTTIGRGGEDVWWLWEHLAEPWTSVTVPDPLSALGSLIEGPQRVWLVLSPNEGKHWCFDAATTAVVPVLNNLHHMEYFVVDRKLRWLIGENHHSLLYGAGELACGRLGRLQPESGRPGEAHPGSLPVEPAE